MFTTKGLLVIDNKKEFILNKLSPVDIFHRYIGRFKEVNQLFSSELREDSTPSCRIYYNGANNLCYIDYGTKEVFNCFDYICVKYGISFATALNWIIDDFGLTSTTSPTIERKSAISEINSIKEHTIKKLVIRERPFEAYDIDYWSQYSLTPSVLTKYNVVPVRYLWIGDELICANTPTNPCYAFKIGKYMKIYRPNNKEGKWYSNMPAHVIFGEKQKNKVGDVIIITKSLKDVMVYDILGYTAIAPQAESVTLPKSLMNELLFMFDNVLVNYDSDATGITFSEKLCKEYSIKRFFTTHKDISDTLLASTKNTTKEWLDNKINEIIRVSV